MAITAVQMPTLVTQRFLCIVIIFLLGSLIVGGQGWLAISNVARASDRAMSNPPRHTLRPFERVRNFQCRIGFSMRK